MYGCAIFSFLDVPFFSFLFLLQNVETFLSAVLSVLVNPTEPTLGGICVLCRGSV